MMRLNSKIKSIIFIVSHCQIQIQLSFLFFSTFFDIFRFFSRFIFNACLCLFMSKIHLNRLYICLKLPIYASFQKISFKIIRFYLSIFNHKLFDKIRHIVCRFYFSFIFYSYFILTFFIFIPYYYFVVGKAN